jgi:hypothetical protein
MLRRSFLKALGAFGVVAVAPSFPTATSKESLNPLGSVEARSVQAFHVGDLLVIDNGALRKATSANELICGVWCGSGVMYVSNGRMDVSVTR